MNRASTDVFWEQICVWYFNYCVRFYATPSRKVEQSALTMNHHWVAHITSYDTGLLYSVPFY